MLKRLLLNLLLAFPAVAMASPPSAEVVVLSTLHQMHDEVPAYSFDVLGTVIERLAPDVLCVELRADTLQARGPERTRQEYPKVVYPLISRHGYRVYAMEPGEPTYTAIVRPYASAQAEFPKRAPEQAAAFQRYTEGAYAALRAYWTSPARVNDATTDSMLRAKHDLQGAMIGPDERDGWERWNRHFLEVVVRAAGENPGRRIVVTVGAEHAYWLREHLVAAPGVRLLDAAMLLEDQSIRDVPGA